MCTLYMSVSAHDTRTGHSLQDLGWVVNVRVPGRGNLLLNLHVIYENTFPLVRNLFMVSN